MNLSTKIKVIIDTNIFISGIGYGGLPEKIIHQWKKDRFITCSSPELIHKIIEKLQFKFFLPEDLVKNWKDLLETKSEKYLPKKKLNILKDEDDNFLLELAEESHASYLVTGDKELLRLKKYKSTNIVCAKSFIEIIAKK